MPYLTSRQRAKLYKLFEDREALSKGNSSLAEKMRLEQLSELCQELGIKEEHLAQDPLEFRFLLERLRALSPKRTLEIGVSYGGTTRAWQQLTSDLVVAVDLDISKVAVDFSGYATPLLIQGDSTDPEIIARVGELAPYDFIWIDGGHDYDTAKADWDNYSPMIRSGGIVGIHDVAAVDTGPELLMREIKASGFRCEVFPGHKGTLCIYFS